MSNPSWAARVRIVAPWLLMALGIVGAFLVGIDNLQNSPDTLYDEAVYTLAAQHVAQNGRLAWETTPVFVHPPLFFLLQAAWINLSGSTAAGLFDAIDSARVLTVTFAALNVGLLVAFVRALAPAAGPLRVGVLMAGAAILGAFDPVLVRYGRLAMLESVAVFFGLLTIYLAWRLRNVPMRLFVPLVGLLTGLSLLVKEVSIFLLLAPVAFSLLARKRELGVRAVVALAVGVGIWLSFGAWAVALGLGGRFFEFKLTTFERLIGVLQLTGWNRPNVSFLNALVLSAPQYAASYLLLLGGAVAFLWLWLRRSDEPSLFLAAWLGTSYAFGAFTIVRGQLNEQFFTYLVPGAIVATVLAVDALFVHLVTEERRLALKGSLRRAWRLAAVIPLVAVSWTSALGMTSWYTAYHTGQDRGIEQTSRFITRTVPACDVVNGGGEVARYTYNLPRERLTDFSSGVRALSRGVHYFLLRPKDVWARYGNMTPDFAGWIQSNGVLVAHFDSSTYWASEIWHVATSPFDPIADIQPIDDGFFVNVEGSACGGYAVVDTQPGGFANGYRLMGGKAIVGRPRSNPFEVPGGAQQLFDTMLLSVATDGGVRRIQTAPLVMEIARASAAALERHHLPAPALAAPTDWPVARSRLTDDGIARAYLGVDVDAADADDWRQARVKFGDPRGLAQRMPGGLIRQAFDRVVWERTAEPLSQPHLAILAAAALEAGLVPDTATDLAEVPNLLDAPPTSLPSDIAPFYMTFGAALLLWAFVTVLAPQVYAAVLRSPTPKPAGRRHIQSVGPVAIVGLCALVLVALAVFTILLTGIDPPTTSSRPDSAFAWQQGRSPSDAA